MVRSGRLAWCLAAALAALASCSGQLLDHDAAIVPDHDAAIVPDRDAAIVPQADSPEMDGPGIRLRFVAVSARGTGSGEEPADAAGYDDDAFWHRISAELADGPIEVSFAAGTYPGKITLLGIGVEEHPLTLVGARSAGTVFAAPPSVGAIFTCRACEAITLRNLHFTGNASSWAVRFYDLEGKASRRITIDSCSFIDLAGVKYGAIGVLNGTSGVEVKNSRFERVGFDAHAHHIYASHEIDGIRVINNDFVDSSGDYVRFRDRNSDVVVRDNRFTHTATYAQTFRNFINIPVLASVPESVEKFVGRSFSVEIANNSFTFLVSNAANHAVKIMHWGYNPAGEDYLFSAAQGVTLTEGTLAQKASLIAAKWKVEPADFVIEDNCCTRCALQFALHSSRRYGSEKTSTGWDGTIEAYAVLRGQQGSMPSCAP